VSDDDVQFVRLADEPDPAIRALCATIGAARVNGGALHARFGCTDGSGAWAPRDARRVLRSLIASPALAAFFEAQTTWWFPDDRMRYPAECSGSPDTALATFSEDLGRESLAESLIALVRRPGAYDETGLGTGAAGTLVSPAVAEMLAGCGGVVTIHRSREGWHPSLHGVAWDETYVILDHAGSRALLFAATDRD
jgi:hypothetical protein